MIKVIMIQNIKSEKTKKENQEESIRGDVKNQR